VMKIKGNWNIARDYIEADFAVQREVADLA
jgi:hypothetical protein